MVALGTGPEVTIGPGGRADPASVSLRELQGLASRGAATVRRSRRRPEGRGLARIERRCLPDGCHLENAYAITAKGCQTLVGVSR